jgi:uncharacterized protein (TIGR00251 family)
MSWIDAHKEGVTLLLHCQPGAKVSRVVGEHGERLKISLNAPAVDNKANEVLIAWLSDRLSVPRKQIELLSGHTSRQKRVLIRGVHVDAARALLNPAL